MAKQCKTLDFQKNIQKISLPLGLIWLQIIKITPESYFIAYIT